MQSLETLNNRTVEACGIYLPDDSFAVNGVQDCCQPSLAPGHHDLCWLGEWKDVEICQGWSQ